MSKIPDQSENIPTFRKSRWIFGVVMSLISFFLLWPGYTLFSSATPLVLGFPISFAWVIFCTIAGFTALLALYMSDYRKKTE